MITVLIASNDVFRIEQITSGILRRIDCEVCLIAARSSEAVLKAVKDEKNNIHMFILDMSMKEINGRKLAEKIRRLPGYKETPMLFLTGVSYDLVGFSYLTTKNSYKTHNYITLPLDKIDIQSKIGLYLEDIIAAQLKYDRSHRELSLGHSGGIVKLLPAEIYFAETQSKDCTVYTAKTHFQLKRFPLERFIKKIDMPDLIRCHKAFALNCSNIRQLKKTDKRNWLAVFSDLYSCPVSITYAENVLEQFKSRTQS